MIVIVTGMHRSGTSAIAGTLHNNGVLMGYDEDFYPPPMKENPKGFYENKHFRVLNDLILREQNYAVKKFDPLIPNYDIPLPSKLYYKMRALIEKYISLESWGWKDPRTCLTLHYWLRVLEDLEVPNSDVKIIVTTRDMDSIVASMKRRGNKEYLGKGQFKKLINAYYSRVCYILKDYDRSPHYIDFNNLMNSTNTELHQLSKYLGIIIADLFIDPAVSKGLYYGGAYNHLHSI